MTSMTSRLAAPARRAPTTAHDRPCERRHPSANRVALEPARQRWRQPLSVLRESQVDPTMARVEPTTGHDLAPGVEVHALGAVSVSVAEQRVLPATEGVVRHGHWDRHVD